MDVDNSKEWHCFKGGILVSLLSIFSYFIFGAVIFMLNKKISDNYRLQ